MAIFFQYLLRLAICFAVMYLFYAIVLRRLTFYNCNRWYLLGYSLLCFMIPLLHIVSFSPDNTGMVYSDFVQMIPVVTVSKKAVMQPHQGFDVNKFILWIFIAGAILMVLKLLIQFLAYKKMISDAELISDEDKIKLYQTDKEIVPFSFGNSIFINQKLHDEEAMKEILRHEFVHVKQKHTLDILWGEILCILNWYNPFVWLIRKAIRENLEFIADDKVVQSGINKQAYQYLLLHVMGNNHFSITNQFNFSSLKKRIAMMNKNKTAKVHLLRFLFLIPLLGVLLVSFRDVIRADNKVGIIAFSGMVVNEQYQPLSHVLIVDSANNISTTTDEKGFYSFKIDLNKNKSPKASMSVIKNGFENFIASTFDFSKIGSSEYIVVNMGIRPINYVHSESSVVPFAAFGKSSESPISNEGIEKLLRKSISEFQEDVLAEKREQAIEDGIQGANLHKTSRQICYVKDSSFFMTMGKFTDTAKKIQIESVHLICATDNTSKKPLYQVQTEPTFPGGSEAWFEYLKKNLRESVPVDNHAPPGQYTITVSFLVHKDGSLSEVKVVNAPKPDYGTTSEAVRVIQRGPKWTPAIVNGKPVTYRQKQKIVFTVQAD